jgi:hypothetical protein
MVAPFIPLRPNNSSATYEAYAIYDIVKTWYFDKLGIVLQAFYNGLTIQTPADRDIKQFRANCILLFVSLHEKIIRQVRAKNRLTEEEKTLVSDLEEILKAPADVTRSKEGTDIRDQYRFWSKVASFEVKILDLIGITRIDVEKKEHFDQLTEETYNA